MKKNEIIGLISVRVSSTRLPKKCLLPFGEDTILTHVIKRAINGGITPIICTSKHETDDVIEQVAKLNNIRCFRGELNNRVKRWTDCLDYYGLDKCHTIDADDPFFDVDEIFKSMKILNLNDYDYVSPSEKSSSGHASVGYSFNIRILKKLTALLETNTDTELVWNFLNRIQGARSETLENRNNKMTKMRLTLDYNEDYWLLSLIHRILGSFATRDQIEDLFEKNPELYLINWFRNKEWKELQLSKNI